MIDKMRNGGFESGDIRFWESRDVTSIQALAAAKLSGVYGGKVLSNGTAAGFLQHKDYIPVSKDEVVKIGMWVKNSTTRTVLLYIYEYNIDLELINEVTIAGKSIGTSWTEISEIYLVPKTISYIKVALEQLNFANNDYSYVDVTSCQKFNTETVVTTHVEMFNIVNETTKHTVNGEEFFSGIFREVEFALKCTNLTGTSPTLDVKIQAYDPSVADWKDIMTFQQLTASGSEFKTVIGNLGWKIRAVYTTAGTAVTDCDFKLGVIMKR